MKSWIRILTFITVFVLSLSEVQAESVNYIRAASVFKGPQLYVLFDSPLNIYGSFSILTPKVFNGGDDFLSSVQGRFEFKDPESGSIVYCPQARLVYSLSTYLGCLRGDLVSTSGYSIKGIDDSVQNYRIEYNDSWVDAPGSSIVIFVKFTNSDEGDHPIIDKIPEIGFPQIDDWPRGHSSVDDPEDEEDVPDEEVVTDEEVVPDDEVVTDEEDVPDEEITESDEPGEDEIDDEPVETPDGDDIEDEPNIDDEEEDEKECDDDVDEEAVEDSTETDCGDCNREIINIDIDVGITVEIDVTNEDYFVDTVESSDSGVKVESLDSTSELVDDIDSMGSSSITGGACQLVIGGSYMSSQSPFILLLMMLPLLKLRCRKRPKG